jgi:hypothetical protein
MRSRRADAAGFACRARWLFHRLDDDHKSVKISYMFISSI